MPEGDSFAARQAMFGGGGQGNGLVSGRLPSPNGGGGGATPSSPAVAAPSPATASQIATAAAALPKMGGKATSYAELIAQMKANPSSTAPTQTSAGHDTGVLKILLKHAKGLRAADLNGKSDPYVIFKGDGKKAKSKVQPKTLDPEWNEMIELKGTLSRFLQSGLSFQV